ncbi:Hypothetical predicted protein [Mytilus galloprovincialis]|uniref:Beta/gamma crystallin 'Greek key' domain-containing protein n=1 Tax=Mytilus galloprovincialis TaxID=29158 RepID=A0A8B6BM04_MYTGA|nr:Hypothetical predicted protein [Mytilus galloprovincialis]
MEPKITLYKEPNFAGDFKVFLEGEVNLIDAGFPEGASSVKVESGVWILYENIDCKGDICVVIKGDDGIKRAVSSLTLLENAVVDSGVQPKCTIYQHHFNGRSSTHIKNAPNLGYMNNDASSIRVESGAWLAYEDGNFGGRQTLFLRGYHKHDTFAKRYPGHGKFPNDRFSSLKALPIKFEVKKQPKITIYKDPNIKETSTAFTVAIDNLEKSVLVESGVWILYDRPNFEGDINVVMEGDKLTDFKYSSIKPLKYDFTEDPKCTIFEHHFEGEEHTLTEEVQNLRKIHMVEVSSIRVHSGAWVSYEETDFKGRQTIFLRGDHRADTFKNSNPGYGNFTNDKFESVKALQIKPKLPMITLYEQPDFMGKSDTYTTEQEELKVASSVIVESGVWVLESTEERFQGNICVMVEGDRMNLVQYNKNEKFYDFKSSKFSMKPLEYDFTEEPKCTIYEHHFVGKSLDLSENTPDLRPKHMNDTVSSIIVHSGAWVGYEHPDYSGKQTLFLKGEHRHSDFQIMSPGYGKFENDRFSSLRALQITPSFPLKVDFKFDLDNKNLTETKIYNDSAPADEYEFRWADGAMVSEEMTYKTSVPVIVNSYDIKFSGKSYYNIGKSDRKKSKKTNADMLGITSYTKGELEVPFEALFHQGLKTTWIGKGTFMSTQFY